MKELENLSAEIKATIKALEKKMRKLRDSRRVLSDDWVEARQCLSAAEKCRDIMRLNGL